MAFDIVWARAAQADLRDIEEYLAAHDPQAATRVMKMIIEDVERLAAFPRLGPRVAGFPASEDRWISSGSYRIDYSVNAPLQRLEVNSISHGSQETPPPR